MSAILDTYSTVADPGYMESGGGAGDGKWLKDKGDGICRGVSPPHGGGVRGWAVPSPEIFL